MWCRHLGDYNLRPGVKDLSGRIMLDRALVQLTQELYDYLRRQYVTSEEISVFLCGGSDPVDVKLRSEIGLKLEKRKSKYRYVVYFAEDMFSELIYGHQRWDLLTLENLLAQGVLSVVILLQSPGTFTELGAFSNHPQLRDKLILVVDPKFHRSKSFINHGPLRYLQTQTKSKVLWENMRPETAEDLTDAIGNALRHMAKHSQQYMNLTNPISSCRFFLSLVYVFDPIRRQFILDFSKAIAEKTQLDLVDASVKTAINFLIRKRLLTGSDILSISDSGIQELIHENTTRSRARIFARYLSELRIRALNLTLRKGGQKTWGVEARL